MFVFAYAIASSSSSSTPTSYPVSDVVSCQSVISIKDDTTKTDLAIVTFKAATTRSFVTLADRQQNTLPV